MTVDEMLFNLWAKYFRSVERVVQREEPKVIEFLKSHPGVHFLCGNGDWWFYREKSGRKEYLSGRELPGALVDLLNTEVPGMRSESLGTLMDWREIEKRSKR